MTGNEGVGPRATHFSYSGFHASSPEVVAPETVEALAAFLVEARATGRRVTMRGAGLSLDSQCIAPDLALSLEHFRRLEVDADRKLLTVGAGVRWMDAVDLVAPLGLLPAVLTTTGRTTVGGTLSVNTLCRFACLYGQEGHSVRELRVMTVDGRVHRCDREENPELFYGVIAGFGNIGVILEVVYRLIDIPKAAKVKTWLARRKGVADLHRELVPQEPGEARYAVLCPSRSGLLQIFARTSYCEDAPLLPILVHTGSSPPRVLVETLIHLWDRMGPWFWWFGYHVLLRDGRPYVDSLRDSSFFMETNLNSRAFAARFGIRFRVLEQTFVVPTGEVATRRFIEHADALCTEHGLRPAIFDVVYLPADEGFLLSSTRALAGFAVNIAFEGLNAVSIPRVHTVFRLLTKLCRELGGRVHLVKNVIGDPEDLRAMYDGTLSTFVALKRLHDPDATLGSGFVERVFGLGDPA